MIDKHLKTIIAFVWMPVSLIVFGYLLSIFRYGLDFIFGDSLYDSNLIGIVNNGFLLLIGITGIAYLVYEIRAVIGKSSPRILTHFRFGPVAVAVIFTVLLLAFDFGMIEYSKYRISKYIFDSGSSVTKPEFALHNNYRSWCGNGSSAQMNHIYFGTASSGLTDTDEFVRARSLMVSEKVNDWLNGGDRRFDQSVRDACLDESVVVRSTAETILSDSNSSCEEFLEKKHGE